MKENGLACVIGGGTRGLLVALALVGAVGTASPLALAETSVAGGHGAPRQVSPQPQQQIWPQQQVSPQQAPTDPPVDKAPAARARAEIIVLHATNDHTGIDPKIGKLPELGKPPFSAYDSYKLLDRAEVQLARGTAEQRKLPDEGQLAVTLKDVVPPDSKGAPPRFSIAAKIQKPGGKSFLPALEVSAKKGEIFFIAGQTYKGGILVIGIRVVG